MKSINLFYEEPDPDRWLPLDRYPRKLIRQVVRGQQRPGGVMRWFLNLKQGLDLLGIEYKVNDYRALKSSTESWACVIGKPHVISNIPSESPIIFGPGVSSHPSDNDFWRKANIRCLLISCEWFWQMYQMDLPIQIPTKIWPAGIETEVWKPSKETKLENSILVYDKIRWDREYYEPQLLNIIFDLLQSKKTQIIYLKYGFYEEEDYHEILQKVSGMIFLCEHETQGFAYQQALSCNVPILAWNRGGPWKDPYYYPEKVVFEPVSSVPYWDDRCGIKFRDIEEFPAKLEEFLEKIHQQQFAPRNYILENLTLEKCAQRYVEILEEVQGCIN